MKKQHEKTLFQIGEIAKKAGTSVRTVRYYLEEGFIEAVDRSPGGFYLFAPEAADTVFFVRKLKDAGLALKEIKAVYRARREGATGDEACAKVAGHLEQQKASVEQKIADYRQLKAELEEAIHVVCQCEGCQLEPTRQNCENCPVIASRAKLPVPVQAIL
uniref:Protein containing Bacterial regulatory protein, MerR domain protein n=1 Tax=uncultured organism TaxID=155900 RepID=M1QBD0_9ZZZZ|nr:protein containing Bacterial regulatory protein, MerR domain protein [uncultured organism]